MKLLEVLALEGVEVQEETLVLSEALQDLGEPEEIH